MMDITPHQELLGFLKRSDNYTQDTRNWPDPTEPRASRPPDPKGCTCHKGLKLECPIHGMDGTDEMQLDHLWSIPENNPVGYPQDQPRNWTQVTSRQWHPVVIGQGEGEFIPRNSHVIDVEQGFVPFVPNQHIGPLREGTEQIGNRYGGDLEDFERLSVHAGRLAEEAHEVPPQEVGGVVDQPGKSEGQTYSYTYGPHWQPQPTGSIEYIKDGTNPSDHISSGKSEVNVHSWRVTRISPFKQSDTHATHACQMCGQSMLSNGWTGFTPSYDDGTYGQRSWQCPTCETDLRSMLTRPLPIRPPSPGLAP